MGERGEARDYARAFRVGQVCAILLLMVLTSMVFSPTVASEEGISLLPAQAEAAGTIDLMSLPTLASSDPQATPLAAPSPSVSIRTGFDGLTQALSAGADPPDVQVAAGPEHLVEMVNYAVGFFSKNGSLVQRVPLKDFFLTTSTVFDPRVLFDPSSGEGGRWFASASEYPDPKVRIAVSDSWDPTLSWRVYSFTGSARKIDDTDQPLLGVSADKVILTANEYEIPICFDPNDPNSCFQPYAGAEFWVLNKAQLIAGAPRDVYRGRPDTGVFSIHPAHSLSSTSIHYMVGTLTGFNDRNKVRIYAITGVPGVSSVKATKTSILLQPFNSPPTALQPDGAKPLNLFDYRVQDIAWFQGKMWFSFHTSCSHVGDAELRSCLRLTQIRTVGTNSFTILQQFDHGASGKYYFFPAVSMDSKGNLAVVYGYSSLTDYPSIAVTGQAVDDPPNTLKAPAVLKLGSAAKRVSPPGSSTERYGDYFGAGTDPVDATVVWVAGEYHSTSEWSTYIGAIRVKDFTLLATPSSMNIVQGSSGTSRVDVASFGGFAGTVALSTSVSPPGPTASLSASSVTLTAGSMASVDLTISTSPDTPTGGHTVTITGLSDSVVNTLGVPVTVVPASDPGGGGSVAYGTPITLEDGSTVPVQNLRVGDRLLGYDTAGGEFITSVVTSIAVVDTTNMLVINTQAGMPLRVDANPHQTLWVKTASGAIGWLPVTELRVGDYLFTVDGWVVVTSMEFAPFGRHVMFDIIATAPYFASGYLDPPIKE